MKLAEMTGAPVARAEDGESLGTCSDFLLDTGAGRVVYALVDTGVLGQQAHALYSRDKMTFDDGNLVLAVTEEETAEARDRATGDDPAGTQPPLDLANMPPLVVGPFGYSMAPAMAGAALNAEIMQARHEARPAIDARHENWHWFSTLRDLPVYAERGELGTLTDVVVNPDGLDCVTLIVTTGHGELYALDFAKLRMVSRGETSLVLDLEKTPSYSLERIRDDLAGS